MGNLSTRAKPILDFDPHDFLFDLLDGNIQSINIFLVTHNSYNLDYSEFITFLEKHLDNSFCCYLIGKLYLQTDFPLYNKDLGLRYLQFSSTLGNSEAIKDLATNYLKYLDVPPSYPDYQLIKEYCLQAMHLGDPNAISTYLSLCQNQREKDQGMNTFFQCLADNRLSLDSYDQLTRNGFEYLLNQPVVV